METDISESKEISIAVRRTMSRLDAQFTHGFLPTHASVWRSTLACVGVVWGDLGTSPLYALTESFRTFRPDNPNANQIIGTVSLIIWSLVVLVCIKYLFLVLSCDHAGEGGIFSLLKVASSPPKHIFLIAAIVGGASMIGDSLITPALSVLSAVEGLKDERILGWTNQFVLVAITCVILLVLYLLQYKGTSKIGVVFGPIVTLYFLSIAAVGIFNIVTYADTDIYKALSPGPGVSLMVTNGMVGFRVLSSVVLAVTGAEAVSADLGHFSKRPIWISWYALVFPSLVLNYLGQGAFALGGFEEGENLFFASVPSPVYIPVWIVVTLATIVASQAMITGCYSLVSQGISLGLFPRLKSFNTDAQQKAQIFMPGVTILLALGTLTLVLTFRESSKLAGAYGISVLITFLMTDIVLCGALGAKFPRMRGLVAVLAVAPFAMLDATFLSATMYEKTAHGGWLPLVIGAVLVCVMFSWRYGRHCTMKERAQSQLCNPQTTADLLRHCASAENVKSSITGIFLSPVWEGDCHPNSATLPSSFCLYRQVTHAVPELCIFLTIVFDHDKPFVADAERTDHRLFGEGLYAVKLTFGYAEPLAHLAVLTHLMTFLNTQKPQGTTQPTLNQGDTWFFVHAEDVQPKQQRHVWSRVVLWFYIALLRVSTSAADFFGLPPNQVVHLGNQVAI